MNLVKIDTVFITGVWCNNNIRYIHKYESKYINVIRITNTVSKK